MPDGTAPVLGQTALDRKPGIVDVQERVALADLIDAQQFRIRPVEQHRVAAPHGGVTLRVAVKKVDDPALADHGVEVEVLLQPFPQLERKLVEGLIAIEQVVGANDRGVSSDIATADPALFEDGDFFLTEGLCQIISGREPMTATADDDDVICRLRVGITPRWRPPLIAGEGLFDDTET